MLETKQTSEGFIKVSAKPGTGKPLGLLTSEQKVLLNRKGNVLFNEGNIEDARRIFEATGYSDGLSRVADTYIAKKREFDALKLYLLAHNQRKSEPLIEKLAKIISTNMQK